MTELNVKLADEVFTVRLHCNNTGFVFDGYLTDETGGKIIEASEEDNARLLQKYCETEIVTGMQPRRKNKGKTEVLAVHELLGRELLSRGVLLVHGSAVIADGAACLFTAPSGTGKSTHTKLWTELLGNRAFIINDDKPLIRVGSNGATVYPSPWGMTDGKPPLERAPLRAIIALSRGENRICQVSSSEMFPKLLKASIRGQTPAETLASVRLQNQLLTQVGLYQMTCKPEPAAAKMAYDYIYHNQ